MLREPTMEKLQAMRLGAMATAWVEQQRSADVIALSFDERFAMLVDAEWMARENKRLGRALKEAKLRIAEASVEGIDYPPRRELDKASSGTSGAAAGSTEHQVVIVSGATGTGKTYVGCALAQQACRKGYRAMYRRASRFFDELRLARADGSYPRLLSRIARVDVLVIDDFAIAPVTETERRDLLEVLEDRYATRATVITQPTASRALARLPRRPHGRRCDLRPRAARCTSHRPEGAVEEEGEGRQEHVGASDGRERATGSASPMVATRSVTMMVSSKEEGEGDNNTEDPSDGRERATRSASPMMATRSVTMYGGRRRRRATARRSA